MTSMDSDFSEEYDVACVACNHEICITSNSPMYAAGNSNPVITAYGKSTSSVECQTCDHTLQAWQAVTAGNIAGGHGMARKAVRRMLTARNARYLLASRLLETVDGFSTDELSRLVAAINKHLADRITKTSLAMTALITQMGGDAD